MNRQHLAIAAIGACLAVAGCSKPKTDTSSTTTTTTDATTTAPAADATAPTTTAPATTTPAPADTMAAAPTDTTPPSGGDLHNTDPTQSAAAPTKP